MDLLLGVLVLVAWCQYHLCKKPIVTASIQFGIGLAADLGLTRPVANTSDGMMLHYTAQGCPKAPHILKRAQNPRTMEERRTVIGYFLMSSIVAHYFQRITHMQWTAYLEDCLTVLEETKEYPSDELLVYLVKAQLIRNKVAAVSWGDTFPMGETGNRFPRDFYLQTFKTQFDHLKKAIPTSLKDNGTKSPFYLFCNFYS